MTEIIVIKPDDHDRQGVRYESEMASNHSSGAIDPWKGPSQVAMAYGTLYVSITLAIGHTVRLDWLALPAVALWGLTAVTERIKLLERRRGVLLSLLTLTVAASVVAAVLS